MLFLLASLTNDTVLQYHIHLLETIYLWQTELDLTYDSVMFRLMTHDMQYLLAIRCLVQHLFHLSKLPIVITLPLQYLFFVVKIIIG